MSYDRLAPLYARERLGYSNDVYNAMVGFGLNPRQHVLDVACGTGIASRPLIENGFRVTGVDASPAMIDRAREFLPAGNWVVGSAEALPVPDAQFDAAISAQAFHRVDRAKAMEELKRAVKPGGLISIWWRVMMNEDPVKLLRDAVARELGAPAAPPEGPRGGFKEFYGARLDGVAMRVLPWRVGVSLADFMSMEHSRFSVWETFGERGQTYLERLDARLKEQGGSANPTLLLGYVQFLYVGRVPAK